MSKRSLNREDRLEKSDPSVQLLTGSSSMGNNDVIIAFSENMRAICQFNKLSLIKHMWGRRMLSTSHKTDIIMEPDLSRQAGERPHYVYMWRYIVLPPLGMLYPYN